MKALQIIHLVRYYGCTTAERLALSLGISVKDAENCLEIAMDPTTRPDTEIALGKCMLDNGLIVGPCNVVLGSWR